MQFQATILLNYYFYSLHYTRTNRSLDPVAETQGPASDHQEKDKRKTKKATAGGGPRRPDHPPPPNKTKTTSSPSGGESLRPSASAVLPTLIRRPPQSAAAQKNSVRTEARSASPSSTASRQERNIASSHNRDSTKQAAATVSKSAAGKQRHADNLPQLFGSWLATIIWAGKGMPFTRGQVDLRQFNPFFKSLSDGSERTLLTIVPDPWMFMLDFFLYV